MIRILHSWCFDVGRRYVDEIGVRTGNAIDQEGYTYDVLAGIYTVSNCAVVYSWKCIWLHYVFVSEAVAGREWLSL